MSERVPVSTQVEAVLVLIETLNAKSMEMLTDPSEQSQYISGYLAGIAKAYERTLFDD